MRCLYFQRRIKLTLSLFNVSLWHFYPFLELYHGARACLSLFKASSQTKQGPNDNIFSFSTFETELQLYIFAKPKSDVLQICNEVKCGSTILKNQE